MKQSSNKKSREATAFLYERLSRDDNLEGESYSIGNQKKLLTKVAKEKGYTHLVHFLDDGISGVTMNRPGFVEMMQQLNKGKPPLCSSKTFPVWAETILRSDG